MHINLESDYAVRLVRVLATQTDRMDGKTLAERAGVAPRFTLKIMQKLVLAGIVRSYKGARGGYELCRRAEEITLREVIEAVEGKYRFSRCLDGEYACDCAEGEKCPFQTVFDEITKMVTDKLDETTFDRLI